MSEEGGYANADLDGGKRRSRKQIKKIKPRSSRKTKGTIIVGKIYANWCVHCQTLKPEWTKMKKIIKRKCRGRKVKFVEIEEEQMTDKLPKFKQQHNVDIDANGFPSLFRLANGKVEYYQGNRSAHPMAEWYLRGGDPIDQQQQQQQQQFEQNGNFPMPNLLADLQGGRRRFPSRRRGYKGKHFDPNYHKNKTHNKKDSGGLLSFLFGK